jgi:hypothetical protein
MKASVSRLYFRDQILFTVGVVNSLVCTAWLMAAPRSFPLGFLLAFPAVFAWLVYSYAIRRWWAFFLADFCYFANACAFFYFLQAAASGFPRGDSPPSAFLPPAHDASFALVFSLVTGPLFLANLPWRVSLVPHSPDKMCSLFIHAGAPLAVYAYRWHGGGTRTGSPPVSVLVDLVFSPLIAYALWQLAYLFLTELIFAQSLKREPRFGTSMRFLTASASRGATTTRAGILLRLARALGAVPRRGIFDASAYGTKVFFVSAQFIYTIFASLIAAASFFWHTFHAALIITVTIVTIYNGAGYYVRVFSQSYLAEAESKVKEALAEH